MMPASTLANGLRALWATLGGVLFFVADPAYAENRSFRSIFFVDDYGAKHNGHLPQAQWTDDRAAISAAITDASAVGGVVQFGAGFYVVSTVDPNNPNNVAFTITAPIVIRGVGMSDANVPEPRDSLQTTILWRPEGISNPVLMKVGHDDVASLEGFGMEDLSISVSTLIPPTPPPVDHVVWWAGVSHSYMHNVSIKMVTAVPPPGKAAFFLDVVDADAPTAANSFSQCWFRAPDAGINDGFGVLIDCSIAGGSNTGNSFYNCKFNEGEGVGADLMIRSTQGACGLHKFVNCRLDFPINESSGIVLSDVDEILFMNTVVDGDPATESFVQLKELCENVMFMGPCDGIITDDQPNPNLAARVINQASASGKVPPLKVPYVNLRKLIAPATMQDGTLWYGRPALGATGLYVFINGSAKAVDLMPHTLNSTVAIEAEVLGVNVFCNGSSKRVGTHESAGQMFKHRSFFDWDTSSIPDGATIDKVELEVTIQSGNSMSGSTNVQVKQMLAKASSLSCNFFPSGLYKSIESTPVYVTNNAWNLPQGSTKRFDLGAAAATVLQNSLLVDWFSVGMKTSLEDFEGFMSLNGTGKLHVTFTYP